MEFTNLNRFYGHGRIVQRYAGLPRHLPLPFAIQHGWFARPVQETGAELQALPRHIWAWSETSAREYRSFRSQVFEAAAPFIYLADAMQGPGEARETGHGTLAFAPHVTPQTRMEFDYDGYLDAMAALPRELHPVSLCLHPASLGTEMESRARKRGMAIVHNGAGPMAPDFLETFIENVMRARFVTVPDAATPLVYSAYLGKRVFVHGPEAWIHNVSNPYEMAARWRPGGSLTAELRDKLSLDRVEEPAAARELAQDALGVRFKLSPAQVRQQYLHSARTFDVRHALRVGTNKLVRHLRAQFDRVRTP